jgi:hypothetical protein
VKFIDLKLSRFIAGVSVLFEPRDGGTQMTIVHRGVPDDELGRKHDAGWTWLLSRLERHFGAKGVRA